MFLTPWNPKSKNEPKTQNTELQNTRKAPMHTPGYATIPFEINCNTDHHSDSLEKLFINQGFTFTTT